MSCCCGYGRWHYRGYSYLPPEVYPPPPRVQRLHELEEDIARIRRELDELRATATTES